MLHTYSLKRLSVGIAIVGTLVVGGGGLALAQSTTDTPAISHPAHIHKGTCDQLDPNPASPLNNVELKMNDSKDEKANAPVGVLTAAQVGVSITEDGEYKWDDMLAESHAINVHESDANIQNYIACGDVGGVIVDDNLVIALHPVNDSGYTGIAILHKDGDGNVDVTIYLAEPTDNTKATPVS